MCEDYSEAGKGAAIGAVASGLKKGDAIVVKPEELLEFKLLQPLSVTVHKGKQLFFGESYHA
jgi:hypothetical protein